MGAGQSSQQKKNLYYIFGGRWAKRVDTPEEADATRTNKNNATVNEKYYDFIEGRIIKIQIRKSEEFSDSLLVTLRDDNLNIDELCAIPLYSGYGDGFLRRIENVQLNAPVSLNVYSGVKDNGKNWSALVIMQDGNKVEHRYTKENPGNLPELEQVHKQGKTEWDSTKRVEYYKEVLIATILPELQQDKLYYVKSESQQSNHRQSSSPPQQHSRQQGPPPLTAEDMPPDDDLPF